MALGPGLGRLWAGPEASPSRGLLAAGQPAAGCAWNLGWAGWAELCLGGLLDGQGLCHTHLGLSGWRVGWAGPEASRRHVRHASRRAEGLGLRLVLRRGWACWMIWGQMRAGGQGLLGQPD